MTKSNVFVTLSLLLMFLSGCDRAHSNQQTLITDDCGVNWKLIEPGQVVPTRVGPCQYKVTVPDYPLQGEARFKTSFANRVLVQVEVAYDYSITDALKYIEAAKYLGRANTSGDDSANSASSYESAENSVIDKRIRDVATNQLLQQDIVDFSQAEFENTLLEQVNAALAERGVQLNFLSFVPIPEEQTRQAIDMITAMKVYESRGLSELGAQVSVARAGATKFVVDATPAVSETK